MSVNFKFILYVSEDYKICRKARNMVPIGSKIAVQDIKFIPQEERPDWLRGVPTLVDTETDEIFTGGDAVERLDRYVYFLGKHMNLKFPSKIRVLSTQQRRHQGGANEIRSNVPVIEQSRPQQASLTYTPEETNRASNMSNAPTNYASVSNKDLFKSQMVQNHSVATSASASSNLASISTDLKDNQSSSSSSSSSPSHQQKHNPNEIQPMPLPDSASQGKPIELPPLPKPNIPTEEELKAMADRAQARKKQIEKRALRAKDRAKLLSSNNDSGSSSSGSGSDSGSNNNVNVNTMNYDNDNTLVNSFPEIDSSFASLQKKIQTSGTSNIIATSPPSPVPLSEPTHSQQNHMPQQILPPQNRTRRRRRVINNSGFSSSGGGG